MATVANKPFAVVTGASSGIGFELAKQCVEHELDVLVCADDQRIEEAADKLRDAGAGTGAAVAALRADLSTYFGNEALARAIEDTKRPIEALILNAGFGVNGRFVETNLADELRMLGLNCASIVHLAKRIVPGMVERKRGRVLITSAAASTVPYLAVYGATKAFELSFAEALRNELKNTGVSVTALLPGNTDTEFFERADMGSTRAAQGRKDDPAEVAKQGFEAMMKGKDSIIAASTRSKIAGLANQFLPEPTKARAQARENMPGSGRPPSSS